MKSAGTRRSPSGRYYDWAAIVGELRQHPGLWKLMFTDHPTYFVRHVRARRAEGLALDDGHVEADAVNPYTDELGERRALIYMRFVPHEESP